MSTSSSPCAPIVAAQSSTGTFYTRDEAKALLENYLTCENEVQLGRENGQHIFGFIFGLSKIKEWIKLIDEYNRVTATPDEKIDAIRIYKAKSVRTSGNPQADVLLVPVRAKGDDYPKSLLEVAETKIILGSSGPCPNVCSQLFFNSDK